MIKHILKKSLILTCTILIGLCVADPEIVYGSKGSSINFTCPYRKTSTNNVQWFFQNSSLQLLISDGNFTIPSNPLYSRIKLVGDHSAGEYNLQLSDLRESDAEGYRCAVGFQEKNYTLELLAAPSSLTLQDVTTGNKILGVEGQSLNLRCDATGGKPPPLVTITVDNVPKSATQSVEYTITTLERRHDRQGIYCHAYNTALTSPLVANATIYLYLKPSQPTFSPYPVSTEETSLLVVSCTSTGSRPAATFQWTIGLANVTDGATTQVPNSGDDIYTVISTLRYNMDWKYNGQSLTCTSVNIAASNGVNSSTTLDVKFAPKITVNNASYTQNHSTRTVRCKPFGNPTTYTYYRWQHNSINGVLIRKLDGGQDGVLTLPIVPEEARYQDSGEYICTAGNNITGRDGKIQQTGSGYVIVNAQPVFISANNPKAYGVFGSYVNIDVYVYSVPIYTSVKWFKSITPIENSDKYNLSVSGATVNDTFHNTTVNLDGYRVTLTIKNLVESDFNVSYIVKVSNNVGQQPVVYSILLVSASGPQTPVNFTIFSFSTSSVSVHWDPGYNGGHEQTFYLQYRVYGSNIWEQQPITDTKLTRQTYTLNGLQDGTLYELRMYAENKFNKSSPTEAVTIETIKDSQASNMGPIIGGVAGGLAAVLIAIGIVWFMIFRRNQDTSTPSKASRTRSDSDVPEGLQHNILYQSAGSDFKPLVPKAETGKKDKKPSTSETEYAEVQKPNAVYASVDKTQQKNVEDKKQKDKKKIQKKPGKKVNKAGNNNQDGDYANNAMSLKDMGEGEYANPEDRSGPQTSHKNQQGLEYADLSFTKQTPQKGKKPVIHGEGDRTLYSEVDHTKKAPPPPQESAYEETNFKHG